MITCPSTYTSLSFTKKKLSQKIVIFCRNRSGWWILIKTFTRKRKRCAEISNSQPNDLKFIDIDYLTEVVMNLLPQNNQELHLHALIMKIQLRRNFQTKKSQIILLN